jgi:YaaC-like Protein
MAKLQPPRQGEILKTTGIEVQYSFWPARRGKRWKLQRRLYVKDPWATLFEAVYRSGIQRARVDEALSYLDQAEHYFNAGTQVGGRISVKPVLLYYSVLNLAKSLLAARNTALDLSGARHGLSADHSHLRATLGDVIRVSTSTKYVNVFPEVMRLLTGRLPAFGKLEVRHLLPQILPAHRLWAYASGRREQFINVEIVARHDETARQAWLTLALEKGELDYLGQSVTALIRSARLPGAWKQVKSPRVSHVLIQQVTTTKYTHRPIDCVQKLFAAPRPVLWSAVTSVYPHRKYYLNVDSGLGPRRLPQWASMYILFFYFSDLTRYRPLHFDRFLESKYGPQVESILDECPSQFLYLMASELLEREVAPAALA